MLLLHAQANTSLGNTIVTMVAFIILLMIIKRFGWSPLMRILADRESVIKNDLATAASEKEESESANLEAQKTLRAARDEATQIVLQAKKQSLQIQDSMLKDTKEEVKRMKEAATRDIELERKRMLNELRSDVTDIALEIAEKIIQREIKAEDHHRLIGEFIQEMDDLS